MHWYLPLLLFKNYMLHTSVQNLNLSSSYLRGKSAKERVERLGS